MNLLISGDVKLIGQIFYFFRIRKESMYCYISYFIIPTIAKIKYFLYNYNIAFLSTFMNKGWYLQLYMSFLLSKIINMALATSICSTKVLGMRNTKKKLKKCLEATLQAISFSKFPISNKKVLLLIIWIQIWTYNQSTKFLNIYIKNCGAFQLFNLSFC